MSRRSILVALALLPAGVAAQDADASAESRFAGVVFPDDVRVFSIGQAVRYPDPALGVALTYGSEEIPSELTVYVYPVPEGSEDPIGEQFESAWQDIVRYAEMNREGVELEMGDQVDLEIAGDDGATYAGRRGDTVMRAPGGTLDSLLLVFEKDGSLIKYRITYERASRRVIEPHIEAFLGTTLALITAG